MNNDDLHSRLGELKDGAGQGLWARVNGGKIKGNGFKNNYQTYQLGYDAAFADGDGDLERQMAWWRSYRVYFRKILVMRRQR